MPACLIPVESSVSPIPLDKPIILIGRHPDCDVSLRESRKISRRHCCVAQVNSTHVIRDLGSMNGIRVNGKRTAESVLKEGDNVVIGDVEFQFSTKPPAKKPATKGKAEDSNAEISLEFPAAIRDMERTSGLEDRETPLVGRSPDAPQPRRGKKSS
ncbi:MAG: FHA domain-containing protein [Planctomycetales bacterium]